MELYQEPSLFSGKRRNNLSQNGKVKWKDQVLPKSNVQTWPACCQRISAITCPIMDIAQWFVEFQNEMRWEIGGILSLYV
jgi:hypothetical protein